jgi:hypothetical protein
MSRKPLLVGAAVAVLAIGASITVAAAQDGPVANPIPDLMSAEFGWLPSSGLDFLPVEGKVGPVGRGRSATPGAERQADADNPNLTEWAASRMRAHNAEVAAGHRFFSAQSRCWPGGVPGQLVFVAEPIFFIQTPQIVYIIWERDHQVRRVFINREHSKDIKPSWFGESVGRYENGELVIDTIGFAEHQYSVVDSYATPHTKDLHVVELWKVAADGRALEAVVTVEDPGAFKQPWTAKAGWRKVEGPLEEWVCAENNLGYEALFKLPEYPMPVADKPNF